MKVKFYLAIGLHNAAQQEVMDFPDDFSEEDIEEEYQEWKNNYIEGYWTILDEVKND